MPIVLLKGQTKLIIYRLAVLRIVTNNVLFLRLGNLGETNFPPMK